MKTQLGKVEQNQKYLLPAPSCKVKPDLDPGLTNRTMLYRPNTDRRAYYCSCRPIENHTLADEDQHLYSMHDSA